MTKDNPLIQQVIDAHKRVDEAKERARQIILEAQIQRGLAIRSARTQEVEQQAIADALGTNRENIRLWEKAADKAPK